MPGRPSSSGPGNVSWTLCLVNGQLLAGNAVCPNGPYPAGVAWDSQNGYLYVANANSNNASVINGVTDAVVGSVPVGTGPRGVTYDSGNGYLYVTNSGSNNVSVINGATDAVIGSVPVGSGPEGVAYDGGNGYLYVANFNSDNVSVINGVTDAVVGSVPVGGYPQSVAYDRGNGYLYVTNGVSNNVSVINGATDKVVGSVPVGSNPWSVAYDNGSGYLYVANYGSNTVSVINGATDAVVGSVPVGNTPDGVVYDRGNGYLYVTNYYSGSVSIITNGPAPSVYPVTFSESGLPSGTNWSVTLAGQTLSSTTGAITFNEPNGTYSFTVGSVPGYTANITSGSLTVNGASVSRSITFSPVTPGRYSVTFSETGLPSGTWWSVTFNGSTQTSTTSAIVFRSYVNGTYSYTVGSVSGYSANPSSGTITVNGANKAQSISFTALPPGRYLVTFPESGLPSGTSWSVTLNGTTRSGTGNVVFTEPNGSYTFSVGAISGFSASPSSGSVTVNGATVFVSITFTALSPGHYSVTFSETGLPLGTSWTVTLGSATLYSTGSSITFINEPNGSYPFTVGAISGFSASPSSGSVTVNGAAVSRAITFTALPPGQYSLTFSETGLPTGTNWSVTVGTTTHSSTGTTMTFAEANGTYHYTVGAITGYTSSPSSGNVTVNGASQSVSITFTKSGPGTTYAVTFSESGLPSGTSWSVTLNSTTKSGTGSLAFTEPNGTCPFSVGAIAGYTASPSSGSLTVNGVAVSKSVTFAAMPPGQYSLTFSETGLLPGTNWSVTVGTTTHTSTGSSISFSEVNGTYHYTVGSITGYTSSPSSGNVTVNGASKTVSITFAKESAGATYTVTFTESGLPAGTSWSVTLNRSTKSSTTTTIAFVESNGTYSFAVGTVSGYTSSPSSGSIKVNGTPLSQSVTFASSSSNGKTNQTTGFLGLPGYDGYIVVGVIVAVVAAVAGILLMRKRGPPHGSGAVQDSKNIADFAAKEQAVE